MPSAWGMCNERWKNKTREFCQFVLRLTLITLSKLRKHQIHQTNPHSTHTNLNCNLRRLQHSLNDSSVAHNHCICISFITLQTIQTNSSISIGIKSTASRSMTVSWLIAHILCEFISFSLSLSFLCRIRCDTVQCAYASKPLLFHCVNRWTWFELLRWERQIRCFSKMFSWNRSCKDFFQFTILNAMKLKLKQRFVCKFGSF